MTYSEGLAEEAGRRFCMGVSLGAPESPSRYACVMRRAVGAALGGSAGFAFATLGLRDSFGFFALDGGNESTTTVILVGVAIGVAVGPV